MTSLKQLYCTESKKQQQNNAKMPNNMGVSF